jgi:hypothetical protein
MFVALDARCELRIVEMFLDGLPVPTLTARSIIRAARALGLTVHRPARVNDRNLSRDDRAQARALRISVAVAERALELRREELMLLEGAKALAARGRR